MLITESADNYKEEHNVRTDQIRIVVNPGDAVVYLALLAPTGLLVLIISVPLAECVSGPAACTTCPTLYNDPPYVPSSMSIASTPDRPASRVALGRFAFEEE